MATFNQPKSIQKKQVYQVKFTEANIGEDTPHSTKWFVNVDQIPKKYFEKDNATLWRRSFDVYPMPSFQAMREAVQSGNRYWLNTNEVIEEICLEIN